MCAHIYKKYFKNICKSLKIRVYKITDLTLFNTLNTLIISKSGLNCGMINLILLVFSFVCFVLATVGVPSSPRFNLIAAGLAFLVASMLFASEHLIR